MNAFLFLGKELWDYFNQFLVEEWEIVRGIEEVDENSLQEKYMGKVLKKLSTWLTILKDTRGVKNFPASEMLKVKQKII